MGMQGLVQAIDMVSMSGSPVPGGDATEGHIHAWWGEEWSSNGPDQPRASSTPEIL